MVRIHVGQPILLSKMQIPPKQTLARYEKARIIDREVEPLAALQSVTA